MKPPIEFVLCFLLAPGAFAAQRGGAQTGSVAAGPHYGGHHPGSIRTFVYGRHGGYGYGGYYAPFYDYAPSYDSGYYPAPAPTGSSVTVVYPPAAPPAVMQTAHPVIHEYARPEDYGLPLGSTPERESGPILYLIAFRDNTIRAAMTYWVEDGTLHYLDREHKEQHIPLTSVDRELSAQLNRERHVPFNMQ